MSLHGLGLMLLTMCFLIVTLVTGDQIRMLRNKVCVIEGGTVVKAGWTSPIFYDACKPK